MLGRPIHHACTTIGREDQSMKLHPCHPRRLLSVTFAATIATASAGSFAQTPRAGSAAAPPYAPEVPAKITTPDTVTTSICTLGLRDGAPDPATVQLAYDQIDFTRGINYLFVPPGCQGALPATGFNLSRPRTNRLLIFYRVFVEKGSFAAATASVKAKAAVFPFSQVAKPPLTRFPQPLWP
jgi:hypothetical protein